MLETHRKLLETYYAAFNREDWPTFLSLLTDDVVHDLNQSHRELRRDAFAAFMRRMNRCYREQIVDITLLFGEDRNRAAAEYTVTGTYLQTDDGLPEASGQTYTLPGGAFFELRDGRIARVSNYYNLQDWLRQIG